MDLSRVIIGPVVTEKAERLKAGTVHIFTLWVSPDANKVDVKKALKRFYGVDALKVRVVHTQAKTRLVGQGAVMEKRHAGKKVMVTLGKDSKSLDLAAFQMQPS